MTGPIRASFADCRFSAGGGTFVLENARIRRVWRLAGGVLRSVSVRDVARGLELVRDPGSAPSAFLYGGYFPANWPRRIFHPLRLVRASARPAPRSLLAGERLEAVLELVEPMQGLSLRIVHWIFPGVAAVRTEMEIRAEHFPRDSFHLPDARRACEVLSLSRRLERVEAHEFFCRTDLNRDGLRRVRRGRLSAAAAPYDGNLALAEDARGRGLFVLKEHPPRAEQRPEVPSDFSIGDGTLSALGWGILPWEFRHDRHRRTYGWITGVYAGGTAGAAKAVRDYQDARYPRNPARDDQLMANCFGNNRWGKGLTERFLLKEIVAAADLGVPIYQPDDGWQKGHPLGNLERVRQNLVLPKDAWDFHPGRFPRGFARVSRKAKRLGVRLGLWYSPDLYRHYRNWREEADLLLGLWRRCGVEYFKIDTVQLRTKDADEDLESMLRRVRLGSRGRVVFNLDITAGFRWGYFRCAEFGNYFLENRLTRLGTYRPWEALRNLWQLSLFVPSRLLQIEVPDVETGTEKYSPRDPARPEAAGQAYAGAVALFASPLFWGELSALSRRGRAAVRETAALWARLHDEIYAGQVFPVGDEPDGRSFPGFQSARAGNRGLAIFYREWNRQARRAFDLRHVEPGRYRITPIRPPGPSRVVRFGSRPKIDVEFSKPHDFRIVRYEPAPAGGDER